MFLVKPDRLSNRYLHRSHFFWGLPIRLHSVRLISANRLRLLTVTNTHVIESVDDCFGSCVFRISIGLHLLQQVLSIGSFLVLVVLCVLLRQFLLLLLFQVNNFSITPNRYHRLDGFAGVMRSEVTAYATVLQNS